MDDATILAGVADIIRDILDNPDMPISAETSADQYESWDSVNHISIVVAVEQTYGIKFKTAEIESLKNVGDLVSLVSKKIAHKK